MTNMETVIAIFTLVPPAVSAVVAIASLAVAAYKAFKAKQYKVGFELTDETLRGVVAAIELLPDSPEKTRVKKTIQDMAGTLGTNAENLHVTVKRIEKMLRDAGVLTDGDDTGHMVRAAHAVSRYREVTKQ